MKTNVTLRVDTHLAREAKVLAARQGTSLSRMMAEQLEGLLRADKAYSSAERRALLRLESATDLDWSPPANRADLYDR